MKRIIWGAVLGAMALVGCQTGGPVAMRRSPAVVEDSQVATQNPQSLERGPSLRGTVERDYKDVLVVEDKWGDTRSLRLSSQTRYFQDGRQVGREFLAPGTSVRASFDDNNKEMIAREIHILSPEQVPAPVDLPARNGSPTP